MIAECSNCDDVGWVCENHPNVPWPGFISDEAEEHHAENYDGCGGAGMYCPTCCHLSGCNSPRVEGKVFCARHLSKSSGASGNRYRD